jgi:hypothetical protein
MEAARASQTSVENYFTRQYIPEDKSELRSQSSSPDVGRFIAQVVSSGLLKAEAWVRPPEQSVWDLWWTEWHWDRFIS